MIARRIQPVFAPVTWIAAALVIALAYSLWIVYQTTQQPWLGLRFSIDEKNPSGLIIASVAVGGPADGLLKPGQRIALLKGRDQQIALTADMLRAPDWFPTFRRFNSFLADQDSASRILREQTVTMALQKGGSVALHPQPQRPLSALPILHWLYLLFGLIGFVIGLIVWFHRPASLPAAMLLVAGIAVLLHYWGAIMVERELALPASRIQRYAIFGSFGSHTFAWAEVGIFHVYPRQILRPVTLLPILLILTGVVLNESLQWIELPLHSFFLPYALIMPWYFPLLTMQWRASRHKALEKAFMKLSILAMVLPATIIILIFIVPRLFGAQALISQEYARLVMIPMILAWGVGLMRYRLFDVELWWFKSIVWILGGLLVLVFDLAFITLAGVSNAEAMGLSIIVAGFLYFPIRQWLLGRWLTLNEPPLQEQLSELASLFASASDDAEFEKRWERELHNRFRPASMNPLALPTDTPSIKDHGLILCSPSLDKKTTWALHGKYNGDRLFRPDDAVTVSALLSMARLARNSSEERFRAASLERKRIMTDLHDTLGARLLTLTHRTTDPKTAAEIRDALELLRETARLSTQTRSLRLQALLAELRAEASQRTEAAGATLHWNGLPRNDGQLISPVHALALSNVLRETVTNALRHARPDNLYISLHEDGADLKVIVCNDGDIGDPANWRTGFGLSNMRTRLKKLGGEVEQTLIDSFDDPTRQLVAMRIRLPVSATL